MIGDRSLRPITQTHQKDVIRVVAILKPKGVGAQFSIYLRMAKMNVVVLNVKGSFQDFAAAILLIAEIVFDEEVRFSRITGTDTRIHQEICSTNLTLSREQVLVPEGNSNSSPSGAVDDHHCG